MKRKTIGVLILAIIIIFFSGVAASTVELPQFRISDIPYGQTVPAAAYGSTTNQFLVVWEDFRGTTGFGSEVYAQLVNSDSTLSGGNFAVTTAADWQRSPRLSFSPDSGRYLVVWEDWRNDPLDDIYAQQVNANGTLFGGEFIISNGANDQSNPDIIYNTTTDQYLVVFDDDRLVASDLDIYGRLVNADGTPTGADFPISTPSENQILPVVAFNSAANQFLVVWQDDRNAATNADIYARRVNGNGGMNGADFPITTSSSDQTDPDVAYDSYANQYLVVWEQSANIFGRLVRADGSFPGSEFLIASTAGVLTDPTVEFDPYSKQFLVAWSDSEGWDNIYGRLVDTSGAMPEPLFDIAYGTGNYWYPDIAFSTQSREFLLAWRHETCYDFTGCDDNDIDIYGALYQATAHFGSYLPAVLRGFAPAPLPSPTATAPNPTATPVTPSPTPTNTPTPTPTATSLPGGWVAITAEDFEGSFPGVWSVYDDLAGSGEYYWGKRSCRAYAGSYSGWAVGGGANGGPLACSNFYPDDTDSWMVYGPFSLADATDADLTLKAWINTEICCDIFYWVASTDNDNYYGFQTSGDSGGWIDLSLDLTSVNVIGDLTGEPQVWIALILQSDGSVFFSEGAYVDDILLRKCTTGGCTLSSNDSPPAVSNLFTFPAEITLEEH